MVLVAVHLKKTSFANRSSYPSPSSEVLLLLYLWKNRNFKVKPRVVNSCFSIWSPVPSRLIVNFNPEKGIFGVPVHTSSFFPHFIPQNTLITKMTNSPRVVEWACLVMMLPTQVSQQTSGDSTCFLSDLKARWEPSCILTKPEICKHKQRTNFLSVSLLFSSKRCLPERRCFES